MNKFYLYAILLILLYSNTILGQDLPQTTDHPTDKPIIVDQNGNEIDGKALFDLLSTGEWSIDPNSKNDTLQLRRTTPGEEDFLSALMKHSIDKSMIGTSAPDIAATDLSGSEIDTKYSRGKILVLNFWFAACPPCIDEIPELNKVYKAFQDNERVEFISITFENEEASQKFKSQHNLLYPVVAERSDICNEYSIVSYPTNIVINEKGEYYFFESGGSPDIDVVIMSAINRALEGEPSLQLPKKQD